MPRRTLRQLVGTSRHTELLIMALLGTIRNVINSFSFTWDGNVQAIWNLPGPKPSFTTKYHLDYWLKTIVSCVVLFRNYTTHLHLIFYVIMLYPVWTGDRHRLMLPWLYLQMMKNIVADVICTIAGLLLCWMLHSCGLLAVEFLIVRIISMMPSIYLWRRLRSYYFDLHYAELDGVPVFPMIEPRRSLTLAQRRRASKSLDGKIPRTPDSDDASVINYSCLAYNEFFGLNDWEIPSDHKISKSLTTLLSIESQDSDDVDDDSRLHIIEDAKLSPAEKTRKILGLTHEEVEATTIKLHKKPSTELNSADRMPSTISVTKEAVEPRTAATQIEDSFSGLKNELIQSSTRCICCEKAICSQEVDQDSNSSTSDTESRQQIITVVSGIAGESVDTKSERPSGGNASNCCSQYRYDESQSHETEDSRNDLGEGNSGNENAEEILAQYQLRSNTVSTAFSYHAHDSCLPTSRLQAIVHRGGIVWENLREINFVSVIKKMLYDEFKPFKMQRIYVEGKKSRENAEQTLNNLFKEIQGRFGRSCELNEEKVNGQSDHHCKTMIYSREGDSRLLDKFPTAVKHAFSVQSSASFGNKAGILALNISHISGKLPISGIESFDTTPISKSKSPIPSHQDVPVDSCLMSSFPGCSATFHNPTIELQENFKEEIMKSAILPQGHHDHQVSAISTVSLKVQWENSEEKIYSLSLLGDESICSGPMSMTKDNEKSPCSSKISPTMTKKNSYSRNLINHLPEFDQPSVAAYSNLDSRKLIEIDKSTVLSASENEPVAGEKSSRKGSRGRDWIDQRSPSSSLGSSTIRKSSKEWEVKAIEALKAYNEKTIFKYKREMDARKQRERPNVGYRQDDSHDQRTGLRLSKQPTVIACSDREDAEPSASQRSHANQILYVPSVPQIETPEKELMWKIDNAYARFTRSKPINPSTPHRNFATKEFAEMYSGGGRLKTESSKVKIHDKVARKQHSKYSKSDRGGNESDVSWKSCKRIEGSQKGRDLDRTTAKANFRAQEIEVYFFERHTDDKPTASKDVSITTIKSFLPKRGTDTATNGSSEISIPDEPWSPMVDVLPAPAEVSRRIEDNEYNVPLGKNNLPENVREAIKHIDWSFGWFNNNEIFQRERNEFNDMIAARDRSLEQQDIVYETTEKMLQRAFAHSENSERGFHLGETANEYYPIFNNITLTMGEIVKAAALRGYRDEFISRPSTENEIPEIPDVDLYNLVDPRCPLQRRSSARQFLGFQTSADTWQAFVKRSPSEGRLLVSTTTVPDNQETVFRPVSLGMPGVHEEQASLLNKIITPVKLKLAEVEAALFGPEIVPDELNDTSGDVSIPHMSGMEDYSEFVFKRSSTPEKLPTSSRRHNSERSLRIGSTLRRSCEGVRLALNEASHESPDTIQGTSFRMMPFPDNEESPFEFDATSCQHILSHFNSGGKEMQNVIVKIFDQLPNCEAFTHSEDLNSQLPDNLDEGLLGNLRGLEFITALQMLTNFQLTKNIVRKIINVSDDCGVSEKTPADSTQNYSVGQNRISPEEAMAEQRSSHALKYEYLKTNTSSESEDCGREKGQKKEVKHGPSHQVVIDVKSNPDSRVSSAGNIDASFDDEGKKLLSNILGTETTIVPPTLSELLRRANFRRNVVNSVFHQAMKQKSCTNRLVSLQKGTKVETLEDVSEGMKVQSEFLTTDHNEPNDFNPPHSTNVDIKVDIPELWITDEEQKVLRDFESTECVIKKMKTVFEQLHFYGNSDKDRVEKSETPVPEKISSVTNLRFPESGELQELHNLMKIVVNYAMITECSSGIFSSREPGQSTSSATKSAQQSNNSNVQKKEFNEDRGNEISGSIEAGSDTLPGSDDFQDFQEPVSRSRSSQNGTRHRISRFSSWDRVIPLSTRLQLARSKRKGGAKKVVTIREPSRRVVKVDKLIAQNNLDFFSARYVPQRGRGLSSGYLMDSDSEGNFTVSRPPTPSSVESVVSQSLSCDSEQPDVFSNPLKAPDILPSSETFEDSYVTDLPTEICLSSSSQNLIGETVSPENPLNLVNNMLPPNSGSRSYLSRNEAIETQQFSEISSSIVVVESEVPLLAESILLEMIESDHSTKHVSRDERSHVIVTKTLPTKSELNRVSPIYASRIEDKLKDVMQQILSHQFSGVEPQTSSLTDSKIGSFISISGPTRINSGFDSPSNERSPEAEVQKRNQVKEVCRKKIVGILDRPDNTPIDELIAHFKESVESTSESSDSVPFEIPESRSRISLRDVAIGTEYNVEVFKDLLYSFNKLLGVENNLMPVTSLENEEFDHVSNRRDVLRQLSVYSLVHAASESDRSMPGEASQNAISPFNSLDEIYLKGTSNSSRIDSPLGDTPTKDLISAVKPLHLQSSREGNSNAVIDETQSHEDLVKSNNIDQVKFENFREKLDSPGSGFHSYDSFESLSYRNPTDPSELLSREISISNHTFLEEFPEQIESSIKFLPKSSEAVDKRSSGSMKSQFDADSDETSLEQQSSVVSSDTNGSHVASTSTSGSKCDAEPKKDAASPKSAIPRPVKNNKGSRET